MRVSTPELTPSPLSEDHVRLQARVRFDRGSPQEETYWFDVPSDLHPGVAMGGDPWLAGLAPLAVELGERLRLDEAVDPCLLRNVRELMRVWSR